MATCARCHEDNPEHARFCLACGAPLGSGGTREARKVVTVLFSDVVDSTGVATGLDPEALRAVMQRYFDQMRGVVERHGGTVEKFVGDAVMAVFGVPQLHEDDALRAVRAATEMREALARLNEALEQELGVHISARTGVNTGEVVAGTAGESTLVTGEAVILAKRLEEAAAPGEILVGELTRRLVAAGALLEPVDAVAAKGRPDALAAWRVLAVLPDRAALAARPETPIIGREREREQLVRAFDHVARERTTVLFTIFGPPGIGKSRLASQLIAAVEGQARVLVGHCPPYGEAVTFTPLAEALAPLAAGGLRGAVERLLAGDRDATVVADALDAVLGGARRQLASEEAFWAVRKLVHALARERPLVLVFDDIHWAGETFLELIEHLADWGREAPVLIVCLARPELLELRPAWGGGKVNASAILLEPLSALESGALIERRADDVGLDEAGRARIAAAAEGNPLFVEQMLALASEDGDGDLAVPPTIQALLAARLDRLRPEERRVLERAAVVGKVFSAAAVIALADEGIRETVDALLRGLVRKELIGVHRTIETGDAYRFRHVLIREAAYDSMPKRTRADLHEQVADWLAAKGEPDEVVGFHLEQAFRLRRELGRADEQLGARAAERVAAAGRRALARGDVAAASALLGRAVALPSADERTRLALLPDLGRALRHAGRVTDADELLTRAIESARESGHPDLEARARIEHAFVRVVTEGAIDELRGVAQAARSIFLERGDELGLSKAWHLLAVAEWFECRYARAEELFERAIEHARAAGDRHEESQHLARLATVLAPGPRPVDEATARCEEILGRIDRDLILQANVLGPLSVLLAMAGRFEEAREAYERSRAILQELGASSRLADLGAYSGQVELLADNPEAAERELRLAYDRMAGAKQPRADFAALLSRALEAQGRHDEAAAVERSEGADVLSQVLSRSRRAVHLARQGAFDDAERLARHAVRLARDTEAPVLLADALVDLAEVMRETGAGESESLLREAVALYEAKGNVVAARRARAALGPALDAGRARR